MTERAKNYRSLSKYISIFDIDWNKGSLPKGSFTTVVGFSMGAILACEYTLKTPVNTLILCSMTPLAETLASVQAQKIIFIAGEKETWCIKNYKRLKKTLSCSSEIIVIKGEDHRISGNYRKTLIDILEILQ